MAPPDRRALWLAVAVLAATLLALPWAAGGRSAAGQAALVLLMTLAGAAGLLTSGRTPAFSPSLVLAAVLAAASALQTLYPDRTIQSLLLLLAYLLAGLVATRGASATPQMERVLVEAGALSGLAVVAVGCLWLSRGNDSGFYANALIGPFGYPNALGGFLLLAGGLAAATLQADRSRIERGGALLACAACLLGLYLTRSRGVWVAAIAGCLTWALIEWRRWRPSRWLWMSLAVCALLAGLAVAGNRWHTLLPALWSGGGAGPADTSILWRMSVLQWTWAMIRDHPWLGVGPGAFPVALLHYQRIPYVGGENPHNLYAEIAAEFGLPAALLVVLGLLIVVARATRAAQRLPLADPVRGRRAALLAGFVAFAVHSGTDLDWSYPAVAVFAAATLSLLAAPFPQRRLLSLRHTGLWRTAALVTLAVAALLSLTRYYSTTLIGLGRDALSAGSLPSAERYLARARLLNPWNYPALYWLAWVRRQSGDVPGAMETAERAVRLAPADPNTEALAGEIAMSAGRWESARGHFQRAVDRAPAAHLRFHAGLLDAAAAGGRAAEAAHAYTRAGVLFTEARVLGSEARCLAPGDRYLLARMSRVAGHLPPTGSSDLDRRAVEALAERLARPDLRGICATGGPIGRTSPEAAVMSFWRASAAGRPQSADAFLVPERRGQASARTVLGSSEGQATPGVGVSWIFSLSGGPQGASLVYQVERAEADGSRGRCAKSLTRFTPDGWLLTDLPVLDSGPCRP